MPWQSLLRQRDGHQLSRALGHMPKAHSWRCRWLMDSAPALGRLVCRPLRDLLDFRMRPASPFELANHDVFVITSAHQAREGGQVATWVMPGSLIPDQPRVVAVLSPMNATYELIRDSR